MCVPIYIHNFGGKFPLWQSLYSGLYIYWLTLHTYPSFDWPFFFLHFNFAVLHMYICNHMTIELPLPFCCSCGSIPSGNYRNLAWDCNLAIIPAFASPNLQTTITWIWIFNRQLSYSLCMLIFSHTADIFKPKINLLISPLSACLFCPIPLFQIVCNNQFNF